MGKRGDAMRVYSGRELKDRAVMWVRLHRRMSDYLQQAPIITLADDDPDTRLTLHRLCERGAKLREVMEACGFNVGLRGVSARALRRHEVPRGFVDAKPSAIAQQIASRSIDGQRQYILQLCQYAQSLSLNQDRGVPLSWMAENLPKGDHDMRHYSDIPAETLMECGFRRNWRWRDFKAAIAKWEDSYQGLDLGGHAVDAAMLMYGQRMYFTNGRGQRQVLEWGDVYEPFKRTTNLTQTPLTPYTDVPKEASDGGLSFHLLNTPAELAEEGYVMQHCVGSYVGNVQRGQSLIYSIRKDGNRLATMEIAPTEWEAKTGEGGKPIGWCIDQVKGVKNAKPDAATEAAANAFAAAHFRIVPRQMSSRLETARWVERYAMQLVQPRNPLFLSNVVS